MGVGDVLKTPKNLVYDFLSSKGSLKQVIEFDQYILSNKGLFLKKKKSVLMMGCLILKLKWVKVLPLLIWFLLFILISLG